jgi:hypothetical protein
MLKCFKQCCGFGSVRIRNFLPDPELEVLDPDPGQDMKLHVNNNKTTKKD